MAPYPRGGSKIEGKGGFIRLQFETHRLHTHTHGHTEIDFILDTPLRNHLYLERERGGGRKRRREGWSACAGVGCREISFLARFGRFLFFHLRNRLLVFCYLFIILLSF